jgi:transcription elongation factor
VLDLWYGSDQTHAIEGRQCPALLRVELHRYGATGGDDVDVRSAGYRVPKWSAGYRVPKWSAGYRVPKWSAGYRVPKWSAGYEHSGMRYVNVVWGSCALQKVTHDGIIHWVDGRNQGGFALVDRKPQICPLSK